MCCWLLQSAYGGVDKSDQKLTSYEIERKRVKKWYKKVFHHLVNQSVFKAHIVSMHLDDSGKLTPLKFREKFVTDIVVKYATPTTASMEGVEVNYIYCATFPSIYREHG